jgi:hypothetical protein
MYQRYKSTNTLPDIEIPDNFPLFRDQNVIDIPVFAYKNRTLGTWHNMDHTPFIAIDNPIEYSTSAMNALLRGTSNDAKRWYSNKYGLVKCKQGIELCASIHGFLSFEPTCAYNLHPVA